MRLYDVGWRRNVEQVFGMGAKRRWQAWVARVLWGGGGWYVRSQLISAPLLVLFPLILAHLCLRAFLVMVQEHSFRAILVRKTYSRSWRRS